MDQFLGRFGEAVNGVLSGWDRMAVRGTIRWLASVEGLKTFLGTRGIFLKNFASWANQLTLRIRSETDELAKSLDVPALYLNSSSVCKEDVARKIAAERNIKSGPICLLSVVEPSLSPTVVGCRETKQLVVQMRHRKCVWLYFYWNDAQLGFGHLRLQTWLPFTIKGNINGHEWLERRLRSESIRYIKQDNCFRWIEDTARAQQLFDEQLCTDWPKLLNEKMGQYFPVMNTLFEPTPLDYYWSADETELSTDVMFNDTQTLDRLFPMLARHSLIVTDSTKVMRYLGRIDAQAALPGKYSGDIRGDHVRRHEGLCVKHRDGHNSVKCYNKAGNILRVETTVNDTRAFKVFRCANDDASRGESWQRMRKGTADLQRRSIISLASNKRYLDGLAQCQSGSTMLEIMQPVCKRTTRSNRRARALNPCCEHDFNLLKFLSQGNLAINGFRNRDLARWINPQCDRLDDVQRSKLTARTTRLLSLLRTHGLIRKVPKTHRYIVCAKGHQLATLVTAASAVQLKTLVDTAA